MNEKKKYAIKGITGAGALFVTSFFNGYGLGNFIAKRKTIGGKIAATAFSAVEMYLFASAIEEFKNTVAEDLVKGGLFD